MSKQAGQRTPTDLEAVCSVFSHPTRFRLIQYLVENPSKWTRAISDDLNISRDNVKTHLRVLEQHRLAYTDIPPSVRARSTARWFIDTDRLHELVEAFHTHLPAV